MPWRSPSLFVCADVSERWGHGKRRAGGMDGREALESRIAHLMRGIEDLSDVVAAQGREIDGLTRRVAALMAREAEADADGGRPLADQRPPHW